MHAAIVSGLHTSLVVGGVMGLARGPCSGSSARPGARMSLPDPTPLPVRQVPPVPKVGKQTRRARRTLRFYQIDEQEAPKGQRSLISPPNGSTRVRMLSTELLKVVDRQLGSSLTAPPRPSGRREAQ